MEVAVHATIESPGPSILTDEKIIAALKKSGPLTIEEMSSIPGMSWVRVFSAVDRLSRSGVVSLRRTGLGYQVVYNQATLSQPESFTNTASAMVETPLPQA
jgi:DNA-binding transcriptional regulator GbsR (MarR family)